MEGFKLATELTLIQVKLFRMGVSAIPREHSETAGEERREPRARA